VLEAHSHVLQAVVSLELYKIKENIGCYDSVLALSCELLKVHSDNFTDFALTLGKATQGISLFRTNIQAMVDGSKLLNTGNEIDSAIKDYMSLPTCYLAHGLLHDMTLQLCQLLAQDLNSDYPSLFNEKKYRELQNIATASQDTLVNQVKLQVKPLFDNLKTALSLSSVRCQLINKNWDEESKSEFSGLTSFNQIIAFLGAEKIALTFKREL
jgi:histidyl-tRNA synthetase